MKIKFIKKHWKIGLISLIAIIINVIISIQYELRLLFIGLAITSIIFTYIITLIYLKQFNFPLFFVREELNYWGGLFGGLSSGITYAIAFILLWTYDIKIIEIIPLTIFAFCIMFLLSLSFTATLIQDLKNTDYVEI